MFIRSSKLYIKLQSRNFIYNTNFETHRFVLGLNVI